MSTQRAVTRRVMGVVLGVGLAAGVVSAVMPSASAATDSGSCVGQLASLQGGGMAQVVHGWQQGQPNPPGFPIPGEYASHLAQSSQCPPLPPAP